MITKSLTPTLDTFNEYQTERMREAAEHILENIMHRTNYTAITLEQVAEAIAFTVDVEMKNTNRVVTVGNVKEIWL